MNIEDLRLPCQHGYRTVHIGNKVGPYTCPGGRVPTRQELIDMLDGHRQWLCREEGREVVYGSGSPAHCWIMSGTNHTPLCGFYSMIRDAALEGGT